MNIILITEGTENSGSAVPTILLFIPGQWVLEGNYPDRPGKRRYSQLSIRQSHSENFGVAA